MTSLSIIIPTYNRSNCLIRALNSILKQGQSNWEVIIVDDGSTDDTKTKLKKYLADERFKYYYKENGGVGSARNFGIQKAKGDFIVFLDSDDVFLKNAFKIIRKAIKKNPGIKFFLFGTINQHQSKWYRMTKNRVELDYKGFLIRSQISGVFILCFKRSIFENKKLRFREDINGGESLFMLKVCRYHNAMALNKVVAKIYLDSDLSLTHDKVTFKKIKNIFKANKATLEELGADLVRYNQRSLGTTYLVLARMANLLGKRKESLIYFWRGVKYKPQDIKRIILYFISFVDYKLYLSNFLNGIFLKWVELVGKLKLKDRKTSKH